LGKKRKGLEDEKPKEAPLPGEGTLVCVVEKLLGGDYLLARCSDGTRRVTRIPGKYRRRLWVKEGDVVLVAPWDLKPDSKCDLVYRYTFDEAKRLAEKGLLPRSVVEGAEGGAL